MRKPTCNECGGNMKRKIETKTGSALFFIIVGILISFTGIGALIGIPMIIIGLYLGGQSKQFWVCKNCFYSFEKH